MATDAVTLQSSSDPRADLAQHLTSRLRRLDAKAGAEHRVIEYLLALGLTDGARLLELAGEALRALPAGLDEIALAEAAIAYTQERLDVFRQAVFGERAADVHPLWLRAFFSAHPDACLGDVDLARARVAAFGDPFAGLPPTQQTFANQTLHRAGIPRWLTGLVPPLLLSAALSLVLATHLAHSGLTLGKAAFLALFGFLTTLGAAGLYTAARGFMQQDARQPEVGTDALLPRTALIMPIFHESAEHVFAALLAMREALAAHPAGAAFEVFVLSDSRDAERIAEEERAFRRTAAFADVGIPLYYRRRARNEHQKAGNLAEFFERFGHRYTYAVVLDADSVMSAEAILSLVRRMEADPRLGLLQAPLSLHGAESTFARIHQFAASVYGGVFVRGLAAWADEHGNYYGHNAVVRVQAFLDCCALPKLRGERPFGGTILSHDFVEAALLCRAGWHVRTATDLTGSYEELPPTLTEYVARDRRWCQGNLQHLQIALAEGLLPMSRIHMWIGVSAYLAAPAWLAFVGLGAWLAAQESGPLVAPPLALGLSLAAAALVVGPRVLGLLDTCMTRSRRRAHGGALRVTFGVLAELLASTLLAPILMLHHTRIIASILLGNAVGWGGQSRHGGTRWGALVRAELPTTLLGVGTFATLSAVAPGLLLWLAPAYVPWVLAIPLSACVSSPRVGRFVRALGLYAVPTEVQPDALLERVDALRPFTAADATARFRDVVLDPVLFATKLANLRDAAPASDGHTASRERLAQLMERALHRGPAALSAPEQALLLRDPDSLRVLHRDAWRRWPVELWAQGRDRPQLPRDASA